MVAFHIKSAVTSFKYYHDKFLKKKVQCYMKGKLKEDRNKESKKKRKRKELKERTSFVY